MYKALKKHEEGHKGIFQQGLNKLLQDTQSLSKPTLNDFESLFHKSVQAIQKYKMIMTRKLKTAPPEVLRSLSSERAKRVLSG